MNREHVVFRSPIPVSAEAVLGWHGRPGAFERLTPPTERIRVLERDGGIEGGRVVLAVRAAGCWRRWVAEHCDYQPGRQFVDVQREGPFAFWEHRHRARPDGLGRSVLEDDITYALPLGGLGRALAGRFVRRKLQRLFGYRHRVTAHDLILHQKYSREQPMKVVATGASGLIGSALVPFLTAGGHRVVPLTRSPHPEAGAAHWDPAKGEIDAAALEGCDAVVHLAGENIAARRWNAAQKARIRDSRVRGTDLLCRTLAGLTRRPRVLVAASAIGYYGDRGDTALDEASPAGKGFLAEVCREWEAATAPAAAAGIRVVHLRLGVVLSPAGGALAPMLTPFRLGLGGRIGTGRQQMSWIALDDVLGAIYHVLATESLRGPVNATAPWPVTNRMFAKTLGRVLGRPTLFPLPAGAARLAFGEMADELLLASMCVLPRALLDSGYQFWFGDLEGALRHLLGKEAAGPAVRAMPLPPTVSAANGSRR